MYQTKYNVVIHTRKDEDTWARIAMRSQRMLPFDESGHPTGWDFKYEGPREGNGDYVLVTSQFEVASVLYVALKTIDDLAVELPVRIDE